MKRRNSDYVVILLKGMFMGAIDAVPGVSGGTIALVTGIYEELIGSISNVNLKTFKSLRYNSLDVFWKELNGSFLLSLLVGMGIGFLTLMNFVQYTLENYTIQTWSFFLGLVIGSGLLVIKKVKVWSFSYLIVFVLGLYTVYMLTKLPIINTESSPYFLFFVGFIGVCAILLPGISGSLLLLLLGVYKTLKDSISNIEVMNLSLFALGAIFGLMTFSKLIKWLLRSYSSATYALLAGFVFGSVNKLWPWKETIKVLNNQTLEIINLNSVTHLGSLNVFQNQENDYESFSAILESNISPFKYSLINKGEHSYLLCSIILFFVGVSLIMLIEKISYKSK